MVRRTRIARLFAAAVAALAVAVAGPAAAGIIPASVTVTPEAGNFRWTYAIVLPTDMKLQSGDYFTIYDFGGLVPGSQFMDPQNSATGDWTGSTAKTGVVPSGLNPSDDAAIDNLTFTYNGPTIGPGSFGLGNFGAVSTVQASVRTDFTGQNPQASTGLLDRNIVDTIAPAPAIAPPPPGVPEPATMALAALGLPFVGIARLLRKKK